jgi:hypothetical protein
MPTIWRPPTCSPALGTFWTREAKVRGSRTADLHVQTAGVDFQEMSLFHKLLALTLLLMVSGAPVMACLAPDAQLTEEEKACCRQMAEQCASADMAAGHSCCHPTLTSEHQLFLAGGQENLHPELALSLAVPLAATEYETGSVWSSVNIQRHPPPEHVEIQLSLRI